VETLPGQYERFYAELADALRTGAAVPVDPRDALRTIEIIEAARQSSAERRPVPLNL
jgi:predicted dehydrogenase